MADLATSGDVPEQAVVAPNAQSGVPVLPMEDGDIGGDVLPVPMEDQVVVDSQCLALLRHEGAAYLEESRARKRNKDGICRKCPFKVCLRKRDLLRHIERAHTEHKMYTEGLKQLRLIRALFCHDVMCSNVRIGYLERSATIIRDAVKTTPTGVTVGRECGR